MNITEIKDLMAQFDTSSLREFSYKTSEGELVFSKNDRQVVSDTPAVSPATVAPVPTVQVEESALNETISETVSGESEGDIVDSPLVGVAYLAPAPDKPNFVSVGDTVKKGQTLLIIEAMKVMNEVPAPKDGTITEILVNNEEVVDFGKGLVRIK
ncbi:acetyl-CoA carboxylase biotin carboxyl carrier protein [Streptococcus sp.]|nr:acetyl-CoA carboxylase biotin carboxyl carrier protein [Streptococcus sp.]MDY3824115.1 acetyl-CoA carboxylase biotin carboxyl carrier protein [Streptococcus sp.]